MDCLGPENGAWFAKRDKIANEENEANLDWQYTERSFHHLAEEHVGCSTDPSPATEEDGKAGRWSA